MANNGIRTIIRLLVVAMVILGTALAFCYFWQPYDHTEAGQIIEMVVDYPSEIEKGGGVGSINVALKNMNDTCLSNLTLYIDMDNLIPVRTNLVEIESLKTHEIQTYTFDVRSIRGVKNDTASFNVSVTSNDLESPVFLESKEDIKLVKKTIEWIAIISASSAVIVVILTILVKIVSLLMEYINPKQSLGEKIKQLEYIKRELDLRRELNHEQDSKLKEFLSDELGGISKEDVPQIQNRDNKKDNK